MRRFALALLPAAIAAAAALLAAPPPPAAPRLVATSLSRAQIRSMPILERPNRPIHFYGNAVRRRHERLTVPAR